MDWFHRCWFGLSYCGIHCCHSFVARKTLDHSNHVRVPFVEKRKLQLWLQCSASGARKAVASRRSLMCSKLRSNVNKVFLKSMVDQQRLHSVYPSDFSFFQQITEFPWYLVQVVPFRIGSNSIKRFKESIISWIEKPLPPSSSAYQTLDEYIAWDTKHYSCLWDYRPSLNCVKFFNIS